MDLSELSTPALCFAMGMAARQPSPRDDMRLVMLANELSSRGEFTALLDALEPDLRASLSMVLSAAHARLRYTSGQRRLS